MLASVGIDADALKDENVADPARFKQEHKTLIKKLAQHGVIKLDATTTPAAFIESMPPSVSKRWEIHSKYMYFQSAAETSPCISSIQCVEDLDRYWHQEIDIAVVEHARALEFGIEHDEGHGISPNGIEVVRFDLVDGSSKFEALQDMATSTVPRDITRDELWRARFEPVVRHSKHMVICDRFAGDQLLRSYSSSGIRWFLGHVDMCPKTIVHVITAETANAHASDICESFKRLRGELGRGIKTLMLTLAPNACFGNDSHDRHIRLDENRVFNIGDGTSIFRNRKMPQHYECTYIVRPVGNEISGSYPKDSDGRKKREAIICGNALPGYENRVVGQR